MSLRFLYRLRNPTDRTALHLLHYTCSPLFHFLSHLSELPSYSLTCSITHFPPFLSLSITCLHTLVLFFAPLSVTHFSFSTVSFSHIPATSFIACHRPGSHSSSLYPLLNCLFCDISGYQGWSSLLLIPLHRLVHQHNLKYPLLQK